MSDSGELFDRYGEDYRAILSKTVRFSGYDADYFVRDKLERILRLCAAHPPRHVLDIGCGVGLLTELLGRALPSTRVTDPDVSQKSLDQAAARCAALKNVNLFAYDGGAVPHEVSAADLIMLANVLHHVGPGARQTFLERVVLPGLEPGGRVVFEHNPYNPATRLLVVRRLPFDKDAHLLSRRTTTMLLAKIGLRMVQSEFILFFPRILQFLQGLERRIGWLPPGAQYMVVGQRAFDPVPTPDMRG